MQKTTLILDDSGDIDLQAWLQNLPTRYATDEHSLISHAASLAQLTGSDTPTPIGISCLEQGLRIGKILSELNVDEVAWNSDDPLLWIQCVSLYSQYLR